MASESVKVSASPLLLGAMCFSIFFTVTAVMMPGPLLVDMSVALDASVSLLGQLIAIASTTWAVTALFVGPISDAYGRKPLLLTGVFLMGIGSLGIGLSPNFTVVTGFSVLLGIGGGMVPPTCVALIGDLLPTDQQKKAIPILTMMPGVSSVLGVPACAVLAEFGGWRFPFLSVGLCFFLAAALLIELVPYNRPLGTRLDLFQRLKWVARLPVTRSIVATNLLARMTWGAIMTFFPAFLITSYGLGTADVALPVAIVAIWATVAPLVAGYIGRGRRRLVIVAAMLISAAVPGLGIFLLAEDTWTSVILAGTFMLLIVPVTTMLSITFAEIGGAYRGTLAGVISCTNWAGAALGAGIGGILVAQFGYSAISYLLVVAVLGSGLIMAISVNDRSIAKAREHFSA